MIAAVSGAVEKIPAPTRASAEESLKRRDSSSPAQIALSDVDSAVVEISNEGVRRAQAPTQAQVQGQRPPAAELQTSAKPANAALAGPEQVDASAQVTPTINQANAQAEPAEVSVASEFDEADANQDGTVNVLEQRAYDFLHPTLARYPGAADEQTPRTVAAELKAYEEVARTGRNF